MDNETISSTDACGGGPTRCAITAVTPNAMNIKATRAKGKPNLKKFTPLRRSIIITITSFWGILKADSTELSEDGSIQKRLMSTKRIAS